MNFQMLRFTALDAYQQTKAVQEKLLKERVPDDYNDTIAIIKSNAKRGKYKTEMTWECTDDTREIEGFVMVQVVKLLREDGYNCLYNLNSLELTVEWSSPEGKEYLPGGTKYVEAEQKLNGLNQVEPTTFVVHKNESCKHWTEEEMQKEDEEEMDMVKRRLQEEYK